MLKHVDGRVICSIDLDFKNKHTFSNGMEIRLERKWNNFNLREVNPQNAHVISAKDIPAGAEILVDYNASHDTYRLFNYKPLSGDETSSDIKYFSVPIEECYLYRVDGGEWQPIYPYTIAERIFEPYNGILLGMPPKQIKDTLYIKSGELKGKVVRTLQACDYCIVFRDSNGQEGNIIVCRYYYNDDNEPRQEIIAVDDGLTKKVEHGELLVGLSVKDAQNN